jgi:uncharacterized protein (DUF58 family)
MMESPEARQLTTVPWLFSRQGLGVLALVTALAATFLATDVTYLAGVLLLVGLGAHAWARLAFARVVYLRKPSRARAFRGDELVLESTLGNPRLLPLPWVEVWENLPADLQPQGEAERSFADPERLWVSRGLALWPYQRLRWKRNLVCNRRGVFRLGPIALRSGDPFGFIERQRFFDDRSEILVYPRVVPLRRLGLPLHHPSIDAVSNSSPVTDPTRTATIRDYLPDDPLRLIHWPSTARRGSLQVRVLEPATSLHVSLLLDVRGFNFGIYHDELLELTLSALASIGVFLQTRGAPLALLANTDPPLVIPPGASVPHLQHMLEGLARLKPNSGPPLLPWALDELPRGNTAVLAASDVSPDVQRSISRLEDNGFPIILLLATANDRTRISRPGVVTITPGCDLTVRLEGGGG